MGYNLSDYSDVNERIPKFYQDHEDGDIITEVLEHTSEYVVVKATIRIAEKVRATGLAQEFRSFEKEKSSAGKEYEPVNMFNYLENCETSAIGRALANFNYSGSKNRPSRQEMEKVGRMEGARPSKPSEKQLAFARDLLLKKYPQDAVDARIAKIETASEAKDIIEKLLNPPKVAA